MITRIRFEHMHHMGWSGPDTISQIQGDTRWIVHRVDAPASESLIREYCW